MKTMLHPIENCIEPNRLRFVGVVLFAILWTGGRTLADADEANDPSTDTAQYGLGVRTTPWQTPQQQQSGFHLPPGFEIFPFAAEPQIAKPLNMAFDAGGRLWVTQSVEYPYPAADDSQASDAVMVLADTDGDGTADEVTRFAENLNIPIGVIPYGNGCLCFSIPNIWYLQDTDGDGKCDRRDVVLGPFDTTRDTHGMINAMRDGGDGWIYACHGFNNRSEVAGSDGHVVQMQSGNTFRFRPDGSRIEIVTHGQVNPFGMTEDDWGYRYSADCHSKPITQLIRGACYPSFGRPHDGLGFLPPTVDHLHGSTAICGILHVPADSAIEPLRGQMISGNVMTSRINRNRLTYTGATAKGEELPDFLTSDDPWFRPVDIRLGPDGHIYVADFYNRIIGHYEVPLNHPGRDRKSGRIWQIRYTGSDAASDGEVQTSGSLIDQIRSTNPTRRRLATQKRPVDFDILLKVLADSAESEHARVAAFRGLRGAGLIHQELLLDRCDDVSPRVRIEALGMAAAMPAPNDRYRDVAVNALNDANPHVVRAAAESLGRLGDDQDVDPLFIALENADPGDHVLRQTIRIVLRDLYQAGKSESDIWRRQPDAEFASLMLGVQRPEMVSGILSYLVRNRDAADRLDLLQHAAKHDAGGSLERVISVARTISEDTNAQFQVLKSLSDSLVSKPQDIPVPLADWATELVTADLQRFDLLSDPDFSVAWTTGDGAQWPRRDRNSRDGAVVPLVDSIGLGEAYTGTLRSDPFAAPPRIEFWIAGHNGFPDEDDHRKNKVRLVDDNNGEILREAYPPRNDIATRVEWDTASLGGRSVRIECIDGDSGSAYAWLAIGRFEPAWLEDVGQSEALLRASHWIKRLSLTAMEKDLLTYLDENRLSQVLRIDVAGTIGSLRRKPEAVVPLEFLTRANSTNELVDRMIDATLSLQPDRMSEATQLLTRELSSNLQREFALSWVTAGADPETLLKMGRDGWISPAALADVNVQQSLTPRLSDDQLKQLRALTSDIATDAGQRELLARLQQAVSTGEADLDNGHRSFTKNCAACHQLRGEGTVVGPQLEGAMTRSIERLLEDVITPDQNVDAAFRTTSFLIDDGRVIVGLVRDESPGEVTVVDSTGKVLKIDPESVEQRRRAGRSLMPSNFGEVISAEEIRDLIQYIRGGGH